MSGATSYEVRRKKSGDGEGWAYYKKIGTTKDTTYKDTGLASGTRYAYGIVAINSAGNSGNPGSDNRKGIYTLTEKPKVTAVTAVSTSQLKITWSGVNGAASYDVYRRKAGYGSGWADYQKIANVQGTEYTDSGLEPGTMYHYGIVGINGSGEGSGNPGTENRSNGTTLVPSHSIDLNRTLDGTDHWELAECGTVDIYINGNLDADDVSDYWKEWPEGTSYEIRDIKTPSRYKYEGIRTGGLSGTVGTGNIDLRLIYSTIKGKEMSSGYDRVLPDGDYMIVSAADPRYYLDIPGGDAFAANGSNVQIYGPTSSNLGEHDTWTITYSDGFYSICQKGSDAAMDVQDGSDVQGANVQVWKKNGNSAQKWAISYFGGGKGYRIQAGCSGMSLDATGDIISSGTNIEQYTGNSSDAQRWLFIPYEPQKAIEDGRYVLTSGIDRHVELDIPGDTADVSDGANIRIWNDKCPSQFNSIDVKYVGNGYYNLFHAASGKAIEVVDSSTDNYGNIQLGTSNGGNNQKWCIIPQNGGYMLVNRNSGLTMDVQDGKTEDGTNVRQHYYNGAKAQTWFFEKAEYKVTYDANGGTGAPAAQTKYYANALTLSTVKPSASDKVFKGWAASKTASAAEYQPGACYSADKDLTLYAIWEDTVAKPQITKHPAAVTADAGTTAKFSVTATGTGLTYQWQYQESGSSTWNKCGLTGAKTANLQVPATSGRNGYSYRCVVTDSYGNIVNSNGALLTVIEDFAITKHPQNVSAAAGKTVQFSVTATGTGLTYQWQYQEAGSSTWNKCGLSGAATDTVSVPVTAGRNGYSYHCIVKNASGQSKTSNAAKLTIPTDADTLSITKHPVSKTAAVGKTVTFSVAATGKSLTYQWQYRPAGSSTWSKCGLEGAKTDTVSVPVVNGRNGTSYRCVVTDSTGASLNSNAATLTLQEDLRITKHPSSVTAASGETVYFTVGAAGVGLKYQWQYQEPGKTAWNKCGLEGAKTDTVTVAATSARNGYGYRCVVTDADGVTAESNKATLTVSTENSAKTSLIPERANDTRDTIEDVTDGIIEDTEKNPGNGQDGTGGREDTEGTDNRKETEEDSSNEEKDTEEDAADVTNGQDPDAGAEDLPVEEDNAEDGKDENIERIVDAGEDKADPDQDLTDTAPADGDEENNATSYKDEDAGSQGTDQVPSGSNDESIVEGEDDKTEDADASDAGEETFDPVTITVQPESVEVEEGQQAVLHVEAEGEELSYQWQFRSRDQEEWSDVTEDTLKDLGSTSSAVKDDSLMIAADQLMDSLVFRCVISDDHEQTCISDEVTVNVLSQETTEAIDG